NNENTGTLTNGPLWKIGKFGKALQFDGTDDYVTLPGNLSYGTSDSWSASLWLKEEPGDSDWSFFLGEKGTNGEGILFRSTTNLLQFRGSDLSYVGGPAVDRDQWNHAVVTYSSGTIYMYLNGTQYGPYTLASTMDFTGIGYAYGGDHYFRGSIDEVKIYPFALTEDEVKVDYNAGKSFILGSSSTGVGGTSPSNSASREYCVPGDTTTCSEPVAEWKFDEGTGTSSFDTSNNENTGTLTNGPLWKIGKFGKAVFFDGASGLDQNDAIIAGTGTSISNIFDGGGSVSFWVKPASTGEANGHFLNKSSNSTGWFLQPQSCDSTRIDFQMRTPTAGTQSQWRADCALNLNQWNHVVVLYNDDAVSNDPSFYINGKLVALTLDTNADSAYGSDASNFFGIGNNAVANETVDGLIDEVRMYDYLRSPAQIAWEYNRGKPVAYYDMNDCTGTTVYNSARNGNNKSTGSDGSISLGSSGVTTAGTCTTSGAWANGAVGKFGSSFSFDGSDDYIDIGSSSLFDFGDNNFSINMWAKVDRDAFMSLLGKWGASDRSWYLRYNATTDRFEFYMSSDGTSSSAIACSPGSDIVTGQWYMVTAMFDAVNNRKYCYTDATKSQITAGYNSQSAYNDGNNNVVIGALYVGNEQFDGQLDELQFFNYVLTKEQRMLLYNNGGAVRFE
ncbi:MAG: hypothetical protein QG570_725, partial [Patescibacteria group bacterium]|nr:hypothetical protein [Patescibacteria group bacterium]